MKLDTYQISTESEFKLRCEAQTNLNTKLEEQIKWYNQEVMKLRERSKKGKNSHFLLLIG